MTGKSVWGVSVCIDVCVGPQSCLRIERTPELGAECRLARAGPACRTGWRGLAGAMTQVGGATDPGRDSVKSNALEANTVDHFPFLVPHTTTKLTSTHTHPHQLQHNVRLILGLALLIQRRTARLT